MIDPPVVKRAIRTIDLAILNNLLDKNWKKNNSTLIRLPNYDLIRS